MCTYLLRCECSVDTGEYYSVAVNGHCVILHVQFYLSVYLQLYSPFVGPWPLFQFLNPIHSL
jgi:hypothetical protein